MEATFFISRPDNAVGVTCVDDIPVDPVGEPVRPCPPVALRSLARALGLDGERAAAPLRDATCRSFPVWVFSDALTSALAGLDEAGIDAAAEAWQHDEGLDADAQDLFELTTLLADLQLALLESSESGKRVCVLLEEKAL